MSEACTFWSNSEFFIGRLHSPFFNLLQFRHHLSSFLNVGTPVVKKNPTHWVFKSADGVVYDSYRLTHQPWFDVHCTIFSLYYEFFLSPVYRDLFQLQPLVAVTSQFHYIQNLIQLYTLLLRIFNHGPLVSHIYTYRPWRKYGSYIRDDDYISKVLYNISFLNRLRDGISEQEEPYPIE